MTMGEGIIEGSEIKNANILDLSPTLLYMLNIHLPDDMDGKVLNIFEQFYYLHNPIRRIKPSSVKEEKRAQIWDEIEEQEIKKRLKALGYLD